MAALEAEKNQLDVALKAEKARLAVALEAAKAQLVADHQQVLAHTEEKLSSQIAALKDQLETARLQQESVKEGLEKQVTALTSELAAGATSTKILEAEAATARERAAALEAEVTVAKEKTVALEANNQELEAKLVQKANEAQTEAADQLADLKSREEGAQAALKVSRV